MIGEFGSHEKIGPPKWLMILLVYVGILSLIEMLLSIANTPLPPQQKNQTIPFHCQPGNVHLNQNQKDKAAASLLDDVLIWNYTSSGRPTNGF